MGLQVTLKTLHINSTQGAQHRPPSAWHLGVGGLAEQVGAKKSVLVMDSTKGSTTGPNKAACTRAWAEGSGLVRGAVACQNAQPAVWG